MQQPRWANQHDPARAYQCRLVLGLLESFDRRDGERILDIGSGTGALTADLRHRFPAADIVGVELSREGVGRARIAVPSATFVQRDLLDGAEVEARLRGWATAAVCSEVLEHVEEPRRLLRSVAPYLAPGCQLLEDSDFRVRHVQRAGFPFFNLYRLVRGNSATTPVTAILDRLFRFNLDRSPFGWQIVAAATRD